MDVSLKKAQYHEGPLFWRPQYGQTSEHTSYFRYRMKDIFIIFQIIPHSLILTEPFGHSAMPFWHFPANGINFQALKIIFLDIFFQTTVIRRKIYLEPSNQLQMPTNIPNFHNIKEAK